ARQSCGRRVEGGRGGLWPREQHDRVLAGGVTAGERQGEVEMERLLRPRHARNGCFAIAVDMKAPRIERTMPLDGAADGRRHATPGIVQNGVHSGEAEVVPDEAVAA